MVLIGEGTYGKVYRPPLPCKGKQIRGKYVGKVFEDDEEYKAEIKIANRIHKINSGHAFSIPMYETCPENLQILYNDGGMDLYDYIHEQKPNNFMILMENMKYVCDGLELLIQNELIHQDIKLENLVFNGKKLYLIDFGLMSTFSKVYKQKEFLKFDYLPFPPEYKYAVYGDKFKDVFLKHLKSHRIFRLMKKIYPTYMDDLNALDSTDVTKIDIYSLGIVLLQLYNWYGKTDLNIEELIAGMICFDPKKRWTVERCSAYLKHYF